MLTYLFIFDTPLLALRMNSRCGAPLGSSAPAYHIEKALAAEHGMACPHKVSCNEPWGEETLFVVLEQFCLEVLGEKR